MNGLSAKARRGCAQPSVAVAFGRLMAERRAGLLAFLGDAPRRAAIMQAMRAA